MSVHDEHLEHDGRPSGAVVVLAVAAVGMLAMPLVVLAAHAAGLGWLWAGVLGLSTPSLFLLLVGAIGAGARQDQAQVVDPVRRGRSVVDAPSAHTSAA